ncbi:hypothetical protein A3742_10290 [Oleiphilus sp. HI0071]|nr:MULTISPECIES: histidine kinase [unclassified Oleiphilus]KZY63238.1 hypothetical protein A3737_19070 [Oleiphilus sp. HI0065]KZY82241.1 hypothetical protein A3742_10290 [Oleiphilus sp. HI0071]KZZ06303.1 hypothetical protein A3744_00540 [Oleiphilus sp. HI0073]KZZ42587.1 hypothetical protein A3758_21410 [Oleiphilus sp. HI0118]KZZ51472.1 hypothetical protein A3760_19065 [Oleiphilus sp. HI0122]KZZ77496.1 hypothetical protein A3767_02745 [Oleiphilus sp. HI0133]
MNQKAPAPNSRPFNKSFIPNLCDPQNLFIVILSVQILAFVITLIKSHEVLLNWQILGFTSLTLHCIGLSASATLCLLRKYIGERGIITQAAFALSIVLILSAFFSWLGARFLAYESPQGALFIARNTLIAALTCGLFLRYAYLDFLAKQREKAELSSRIEALQSRIRPHFLFNSMNSIASLISSKPEQAENAVLDLSELFRATLNTKNSYVTIREELKLCEKYLNIEGLRLGERLKLEWQIEDQVLNFLIPPLTLQPLVENAIYHGIQPIPEGGTIRFEAYLKQKTIYLLISNPVSSKEQTRHGNQIALGNIADRLAALYSDQALIKTSKLDDVFTTTLRLPARTSR